MSLQGIDISNHKAEIDLAAVAFDFCFVQTTWGNGEVSANGLVNGVWTGADAKIQQLRKMGKLWGFMHYIRGHASPEQEAQFAYNHNKGYFHEGVPAVDWESNDNMAFNDISYLDRWLAEFIRLSGVKPLIYCPASSLGTVRSVADKRDCGLWAASYATSAATGYQDTPWNDTAYGKLAMRQYSSNGRLSGFGAPLDLDKFYGNADEFRKYANPTGKPAPAPAPVSKPAPQPPQKPAEKPNGFNYVVRPGDTVSGLAARFHVPQSAITGYASGNPNQIRVGETLHIGGGSQPQAPKPVYHRVAPGDTLSGLAAKYGTSVQRLVELNNIKDRNRIYVGTTLRMS